MGIVDRAIARRRLMAGTESPVAVPAVDRHFEKRIYTYQYSSMLILIYFAEACMRLADTAVASRICAAVSVLLCIAFFLGCLAFIKQQKHTSK